VTLKYTLDQVLEREARYIGVKRLPNPWWPGTAQTGNDCVAYQTERLGLRTGKETLGDLDDNPYWISIKAFRAHYGWDETTSHAEMQAGDLVGWNFSGGSIPEHMGFIASIDHRARTVTTIEANTSPAPGIALTLNNRGVWKKTRDITGSFLVAIRPPYLGQAAVTTKSRKDVVRFIAAYLNDLPELAALPNSAAENDGIEGPVYWTLVQTWGRIHHQYGDTFHIDGVPGPRTRDVEAAVYKAAKAAG
jgi:hypothetical protein